MFLVNLSRTWPAVRAGRAKTADVTLGAWAQIKDADLEKHADVILGIYKNQVVTAFDIEDWTRGEDGRVTFVGQPSERWAHLIDTPTPGKPWVAGEIRPVKVLPTTVLVDGDVPIEDTPAGRRAVVDGYTLTVEAGAATLHVPERGKVTVCLLPS